MSGGTSPHLDFSSISDDPRKYSRHRGRRYPVTVEKLIRKRTKPSRASQSRSAVAHASPGARNSTRNTPHPQASPAAFVGCSPAIRDWRPR